MLHSDSLTKLAAALAQAQGEMPAAPMNSVNPFLKNKFADLGAVIEASRPVLAKHGLSISQFPTAENGSIGVTSILMHNSGEWIQDTITMALSEEKGKSAAQVAGSVITYLRRYSWASMLGMYADEDTDGHQPERKPEAKPEQKQEMSEAEKKQAVLAAWSKLQDRAKKVKVKLAPMDGGWDSADMKKHYAEQKQFVVNAEEQAEAA